MALKAIELEPATASAHAVLAKVGFARDWNRIGSAQQFTTAIDLDPNDASIHSYYGNFLVTIGALEEGLAEEPKAVKDGKEVVRILLKLQPKAAAALERLTSDRLGRQIAIVGGGEVVTMHKIREVIKGGEVQITSCAAGAANYLLEQLQAHYKSK